MAWWSDSSLPLLARWLATCRDEIQLNTLLACFNVASGDVEDAPALDPLAKFEILEKEGGVFIKGDEATIKAKRRSPSLKCSASGGEHVVIVGGFATQLTPILIARNEG